ncbi:unnamed protein product [Blepharisma stoltei]|uniref:Maturase K n=1 Tax=Blepharisma stoltei TaxID=1481888 RepID=A0AAU9J5R6_9CILI|nr:unnamed protein product [Blepharisma stoltei]
MRGNFFATLDCSYTFDSILASIRLFNNPEVLKIQAAWLSPYLLTPVWSNGLAVSSTGRGKVRKWKMLSSLAFIRLPDINYVQKLSPIITVRLGKFMKRILL